MLGKILQKAFEIALSLKDRVNGEPEAPAVTRTQPATSSANGATAPASAEPAPAAAEAAPTPAAKKPAAKKTSTAKKPAAKKTSTAKKPAAKKAAAPKKARTPLGGKGGSPTASGKSRKELYAEATALEIKGRSSMTKEQLLEAIAKARR